MDAFVQRRTVLKGCRVFVGFDGFVDCIMRPVDKRRGAEYTVIPTIQVFGERIIAAAGKSTNLEWVKMVEKIGGNGPILAQALALAGVQVHYVGTLGKPIHSVFQTFCERAHIHSVGEPGISHAAEFDDGKVIFGSMASFFDITYEKIVAKVGLENLTHLLDVDLCACVNWTMMPHMASILNNLVPIFQKLKPKQFFFDLADPAKRSREDVINWLDVFKFYSRLGHVTLGLNFSEAVQMMRLFDDHVVADTPAAVTNLTTLLRQKLNVQCVVVHPTHYAVAATESETVLVEGECVQTPKITTGAGDHFNAGWILGDLLQLSTQQRLELAVNYSAHYVKTGLSTLDVA